jgi:hypothetical protein
MMTHEDAGQQFPFSTERLLRHDDCLGSRYEGGQIPISFSGSIVFSWVGDCSILFLKTFSFSCPSSLTEQDK